MVVDTIYYDALLVPYNATEADIKKAYRRQAIRLHPDKNPGDETAHEKFQEVSEAYQVLSNPQLRAAYDKYGKERAQPREGFEDPSEFFGMIFGGEAFLDLIGELSLMKDLTKQMDITSRDEELTSEPQGTVHAPPPAATLGTAAPSSSAQPSSSDEKQPPLRPATETTHATSSSIPPPSAPGSGSGTSTPSRRTARIPNQQLLTEREDDPNLDTIGMTDEEKELRKAERKKGGLTKEQRDELNAYEAERKRIRHERVETLARKLADRLSVWTETDHGRDVTAAFEAKTKLEAEELKMESFGLEILHAVGSTYVAKASAFLKSQKFLGLGGFWARLKDKGTIAKDTWATLSTAIDAQMTMEEMAKLQERGGQDWTDERRADYERLITGKILAAAWRGSRLEISAVLREVCDRVLLDERGAAGGLGVSLEKRIQRAHALAVVGNVFLAARRSPDEENEYMVFEQLMADAAKKRERQRPSAREKEKEKEKPKGEGPGEGVPDPAAKVAAEKAAAGAGTGTRRHA